MGSVIRPSSDLRNHYNEISKQCKESREAVIITVNGRGDTAVLGLQDYYQMKSELEVVQLLSMTAFHLSKTLHDDEKKKNSGVIDTEFYH